MTQSSIKTVWVEGFLYPSLTRSKFSTQIVSPAKSAIKYTDKMNRRDLSYQCKTPHHICYSIRKCYRIKNKMRQLMRDLEQVHAPHLAIDIRRMNFIGYIHRRLLSYSAIPYEEASVWTFINILHHLESCLVLPCVPTPIVQALPMVYLDDIKELIRISYCFCMLLCSYYLSLNSASALLNTNLV